jgi:peptide/nickel transport system permease protein
MFSYLVRRVIYTIPILFGIALITFLLFNVAGGDPVLQMLGKHADARSIAELRIQLGLDRPWYYQFADTLRQMFTFDFGRSYATKQEITAMMASASVVSLSMTVPAFIVLILVSVAIALFVSFWRGTWVDKLIVFICVIGISVPSLSYILFGQNILAYQLDLFPISGYSRQFPAMYFYLALPMTIWILINLGGDVRFFRTVVLDEVNQDYVRTARAKGLSESRVMFKHVLKNAMIPIITHTVIVIPYLILGSLLLENFFSIPGMGSMLVDALQTSDFPVVRAWVMVISMLYCLFNLLTDICYKLVDPRISFG